MSPQARYWLLTLPHRCFMPYLPPGVVYIRGQLEQGEGGFLHWQILVVFERDVRLLRVKSIFGDECHAEPSRSKAADAYVWKDNTAVIGTRFELGSKPFKRNCQRDWDTVFELAKSGQFESIDKSILVPHYGAIKRIRQDHLMPIALERTVHVFWGSTGSGKSRRAWAEAGMGAYPKDPNTKFWDGYNCHEHVVIDEFRGRIDISHLLRWLDRYPVIVEIKGSSTCLVAKTIWITSNLDPRCWYPDLDEETKQALLRRLIITHFDAL